MRALTVRPGQEATPEVVDLDPPEQDPSRLLVDGIAVGICGTDHEIASGKYGEAPSGDERLVIGHESLGRVREAPADADFSPGDLVVGVVRRPDPVPCPACARGEFDMCRNGEFTERGIKGLHGYASTTWSVEPEYAVRLDPALAGTGVLIEPTSVVAKAWEQVHAVGSRSFFDPQTVLVTGAGPVGLLAALLGVQRDLEVHVLDQVTSGPKPDLVRSLGASYHSGDIEELGRSLQPDIVIEATGASRVVLAAMRMTAAYGITCLTGVSSGGRTIDVDLGAVNRSVVLENDVVIGSVNANLRHYEAASEALLRADPDWLARVITRRVPLERAQEAFERRDDDVKVVVDLEG